MNRIGCFLLIAVLALPAPASFAAESTASLALSQGIKTPYDTKLAEAGFFSITPLPSQSLPPENLENLFRKARSFRYSREAGPDHWQSPSETERKKSGDCEDKALWLYANLVHHGYDSARLVVGRFRSADRGLHVWVTVSDSNNVGYLLDPSGQKKPWREDQMPSGQYLKLYSFNTTMTIRHAP